MKRIFFLFLTLLVTATVTFSVSAQDIQDAFEPSELPYEHIETFDSAIVVNTDGSIDVKETIVYDFYTYDRHGIFRDIPYVKVNKEDKRFEMDMVIKSVQDENGKDLTYVVTKNDDEMKVKIGDADKIITGQHTYVITYKVYGALTYFSDHDELYWNVTGNGWKVPIRSAIASVTLPTGENIQGACYTGSLGSTASDCTVVINGSVIDYETTAPVLHSGEGLTIVAGFPKGVVAVVEPKEIVPFFSTPFGKFVGAVVSLSVFLVSLFWFVLYPIKIILKWLAVGRDPSTASGPVQAGFDPPVDKNGRKVTPAEAGAVLDETAEVRDVFSMIVDFARRGYLVIKEEKKDKFSFVKLKEAGPEMLPFERTFFGGIFGAKEELNLKTAYLATDVALAQEQIYTQLVDDGFFPKNPQSTRTFYWIIFALALFTFNLPLVVIALAFGMNMPAKTVLGTQAKDVAQSLKNFLSSQERQLKFQAEKQMFFEKLLPYAVAFGVEKVWIERFEKMGIKNPDWYEGYEGSRFNSAVLYHAIHSSYSNINRSVSSTSSSSGFSSGFSGGGSSGGGGGGGGGGSW